MNVAILGKSQVNDLLEKKLSEEGFTPCRVECLEDITGFSGERLDYIVRTTGQTVKVGHVIVTEEPVCEKPFSNHYRVTVGNEPVVFILDYPSESPAHYTVDALENAIKLARRRKQVFYLSRFMRTAGYQTENLYKEARNAGVTFIKYLSLEIACDTETGLYRIMADDGYDALKLESTAVIKPESSTASEKMDRIARLLRLKCNEDSSVNDDRSFLFPTLTSRNGIYFIHSSTITAETELQDRIAFTISEMKERTGHGLADAAAGKEAKGIEIDAGKCAFCYTCFRACPHSAMAPDYENSVMKNLGNGCQTCGICVSVCPADAVKMKAEKPVDGVKAPNALKILCCENSGKAAAQMLKHELAGLFERIETVPVSCGGEISVETITADLKHYGKVLVLTCMDDACKHFEGNKRAARFVEKTKALLAASGLDEKRVECMKLSHAMPMALRDQILEMMG